MTVPYDQSASDADDGAPGYPLPATRPEPVVDAARVGGLISALVVAAGGGLVLAGLASTEDVSRWTVALSGIVTALVALFSYLAPVFQARKARSLVTPLASPRSAAGVRLVEDRRAA